jgi:hypothetical protein
LFLTIEEILDTARLYDPVIIHALYDHASRRGTIPRIIHSQRAKPASLGDDADTPPAEQLIIPIIIAVAACALNNAACLGDADSEYGACIRACDFHHPPRVHEYVNLYCTFCCTGKHNEDIEHCMLTCGQNGPDGDYDVCWEYPQPPEAPLPAGDAE